VIKEYKEDQEYKDFKVFRVMWVPQDLKVPKV
jgi:hypothetical protein